MIRDSIHYRLLLLYTPDGHLANANFNNPLRPPWRDYPKVSVSVNNTNWNDTEAVAYEIRPDGMMGHQVAKLYGVRMSLECDHISISGFQGAEPSHPSYKFTRQQWKLFPAEFVPAKDEVRDPLHDALKALTDLLVEKGPISYSRATKLVEREDLDPDPELVRRTAEANRQYYPKKVSLPDRFAYLERQVTALAREEAAVRNQAIKMVVPEPPPESHHQAVS